MDTPKTEKTYLFTFSPKGVTKSYDYTYIDHYVNYFEEWSKCMEDFEINPELNASGNLHYHGFYIVKDKYKWFKKVLPKLKYNGMWRIEEVKHDLEKAMIYCRKDRELMISLMNYGPIPLTKTNCTIPFNSTDNLFLELKDYGFNNNLDYI